MRRPLLFSLFVAPLLVACSGASGTDADGASSESQELRTTYVDARDWLSEHGGDIAGWDDAVWGLRVPFAAACATSWCKATPYSNLSLLDVSCSVSSVRGALDQCAITLAGSEESYDATTGAFSNDAPRFVCKIAPRGTPAQLQAVLAGTSPMTTALPGLTTTLRDGIDACVNPIGATKLPPIHAGGSFIDARTVLGAKGAPGWAAMTTALVKSFDQICGDTYCSGDFSNLTSLRFRCSVNARTHTIAACEWVFGGSYALVTASTGTVNATTKTAVCPVPVKGTVEELVSALTAPGTEDAVHRTLPGETTSAYDALGGCL
jgi:hypothetical protein